MGTFYATQWFVDEKNRYGNVFDALLYNGILILLQEDALTEDYTNSPLHRFKVIVWYWEIVIICSSNFSYMYVYIPHFRGCKFICVCVIVSDVHVCLTLDIEWNCSAWCLSSCYYWPYPKYALQLFRLTCLHMFMHVSVSKLHIFVNIYVHVCMPYRVIKYCRHIRTIAEPWKL